jgi:hypothetical protein
MPYMAVIPVSLDPVEYVDMCVCITYMNVYMCIYTHIYIFNRKIHMYTLIEIISIYILFKSKSALY